LPRHRKTHVGLLEPALAAQAPGEPVVGKVAAHRPVAAEGGGDRVGGAQHPRIAPATNPTAGSCSNAASSSPEPKAWVKMPRRRS
jgi:hypothetical protein